MKTKFLSLAFISAVVLFAVSSCSKEQKLSKELDGNWNAKYIVIAGVQVDVDTLSSFSGFPISSAMTLTFEKCSKPTKGCPGHMLIAGSTIPFTYTLDGEEINILGQLYQITDVTDDRLTMSADDGNGGTYQIIFLKQ